MEDIFKKLRELDDLAGERIIHSITFVEDGGWALTTHNVRAKQKYSILGSGLQEIREQIHEIKLKYRGRLEVRKSITTKIQKEVEDGLSAKDWLRVNRINKVEGGFIESMSDSPEEIRSVEEVMQDYANYISKIN